MEPSPTCEASSPRLGSVLSLRKKIAFAAIPSIAMAILVSAWWLLFFPKQGPALARYAWEQTFVERHVPIPSIGPRDGGFLGERISPKSAHPATKWCEPPVDVPGILEIDTQGRQYYRPASPARHDILVIGSSVATGVFATTTANTYFGQVGAELESQQDPASITVFASGAWKSVQEVAALQYSIESGLKPNLVILINGLNDLTNGATTEALYGQVVPTKDGSRWSALYHEHDYARRVGVYLRNMRNIAAFAGKHDLPVLIVLQPALFERAPLTRIERQLLAASLAPHKSKEALLQSYEQMRSGLKQMADDKHVFFLDCSRIFNGESATTFTDIWHFTDFGHQILANELTPVIRLALQKSSESTSK